MLQIEQNVIAGENPTPRMKATNASNPLTLVSAEKLEHLLARQMPDEEKRRRAHFVVDTNGPPGASLHQLDAILQVLKGRRAQAYARFWSGA